MAGKPRARARKRAIERAKAKGSSKKLDPRSVPNDAAARAWFCAELMAADRWAFTETHRELAAAWGVQPATIKGYAAEANHLLRLDVEQLETLKLINVRSLLRIAQKAEAMKNKVTGLPDFRAAIDARCRAYDLVAPSGEAPPAPTRIEIVHTDEPPAPPPAAKAAK